MNFRCGDQVVYGAHGVCRIVDVEQRNVDHKTVEYFVLAPCGPGDARYFVPMHNQVALSKMRKLLTRQELEELLVSEEVMKDHWIPQENLRKERYRTLISHGACSQLMGMIRSLHLQKQLQLEAGRKFHMCDENFLRDAQRILCAEVSHILGITPQEADAYLRDQLEK